GACMTARMAVGAAVERTSPATAASGLVARMQLRLRRSVACVVGGTVLAGVIAVALLAPVLATHDPIANNLADRLQPPSRAHLFGTADFGPAVWRPSVRGAGRSLRV